MPVAADTDEQLCDEQLEVLRRRYQEARASGLSIAEATLFAESSQDIGLLRMLVAGSCDPALIARIIT